MALTLTPTSLAGSTYDNFYNVYQSAVGTGWGIRRVGGDQIQAYICYTNQAYGAQTTDAPLVVGRQLRIVARFYTIYYHYTWNDDVDVWVNGTKRAMGMSYFHCEPLRDSGMTLQIGDDDAAHTNMAAFQGVYSEIALWRESVPDWWCVAYGQGASPALYPRNGFFYAPLANGVCPINVWDKATVGTVTSGLPAAHPPVDYRLGRHGLTADAKLHQAIKGGLLVGGHR
jgi:hypothetical protein